MTASSRSPSRRSCSAPPWRASRPADPRTARPIGGPHRRRRRSQDRRRPRSAASSGPATSTGTTTRPPAAPTAPPSVEVRRSDRRRLRQRRIPPTAELAVEGPFLEDGTLLKPIAVDTTRRGRQRPAADLQGEVGRHARRHRRQVRRLDDDRLVGERPQEQERPPHRPGPDDPAGDRPRRHGRRRPTRSTRSPPSTTSTSRTSSTTNGLEDPNLVVGQVLVDPGRRGQGDPIPKPPKKTDDRAATTHAFERWRRHRPAAHAVRRRALPVAGRRWRQLHQPVLPLRPLRDRHRRRLRLDRAGRRRAGR